MQPVRGRRTRRHPLCQDSRHQVSALGYRIAARRALFLFGQFGECALWPIASFRQAAEYGSLSAHSGHNPARDVPYLESNNPSGYHTWTPEEVRQFEARHPVGTKARLALALLLFTGQRRSDITRLGRQHAHNGKLTFTQFKGRNHKPKRLVLPILAILQQIIDASPSGDLAYLVNDLGRPFTDAGFGNKFREWCNQAGLRNCSAHGLRKAGATIAANNGATAHQLMAIFGWNTLKMAEAYTRAADQERLAKDAMHMLESLEQNGTKSCPTEEPGGTFLEKRSTESRTNLEDGAVEGTSPRQ